jgi:hypothetical protein
MPIEVKTFYAGEALDVEATHLHRFVYSDGADAELIKLATSGRSRAIVGVLDQMGADNAAVRVVIAGWTKVRAGGTLEPLDVVTCDTAGGAIKWTPDSATIPLGIYVPGGAAGTVPSMGRDGASSDYVWIRLLPGPRVLSTGFYASGTLNFGSIGSAGSGTNHADLTIAITSVATADVATGGLIAIPTGLVQSGPPWVSAAGVVTVRVVNTTDGEINPAAITYRISVTPRVTAP